MSTTRIAAAMKKSTAPESADEAGTMARGKYTLLISLELEIRLLPASGNAYWKYVNGTMPRS
jgi:hypothetical protein